MNDTSALGKYKWNPVQLGSELIIQLEAVLGNDYGDHWIPARQRIAVEESHYNKGDEVAPYGEKIKLEHNAGVSYDLHPFVGVSGYDLVSEVIRPVAVALADRIKRSIFPDLFDEDREKFDFARVPSNLLLVTAPQREGIDDEGMVFGSAVDTKGNLAVNTFVVPDKDRVSFRLLWGIGELP